MKTYSELIKIPTFEERYEYLNLHGSVAEETFGHNRYLNQKFYSSPEWKEFRRDVIIRDLGCDLAIEDREIFSQAYIHHINPITHKDILNRSNCLFDFENVITTTFNTHQAIHYGDESLLFFDIPIRKKGDTKLW